MIQQFMYKMARFSAASICLVAFSVASVGCDDHKHGMNQTGQCCSKDGKCCKTAKTCGDDCKKVCCSSAKKCGADCKKACCASAKKCGDYCKKPCCKTA